MEDLGNPAIDFKFRLDVEVKGVKCYTWYYEDYLEAWRDFTSECKSYLFDECHVIIKLVKLGKRETILNDCELKYWEHNGL